jgi:hypothetical protein
MVVWLFNNLINCEGKALKFSPQLHNTVILNQIKVSDSS